MPGDSAGELSTGKMMNVAVYAVPVSQEEG
jgi:hypothetical protein